MTVQSVPVFNEQTAQLQSLDRQRRLAELLQGQAVSPIETSSYNGMQAPVSPLQGLAKMLQAYSARKMEEDSDNKYLDLVKQSNQQLAEGLANYQRTMQGTPGTPDVPAMPERPYSPQIAPNMPLMQTPSDVQPQQPLMQPETQGQPATPAVPGDRNAAFAQLLASRHPALQQLGMAQIAAEPDREQRVHDALLARQDRQLAREQQSQQFGLQLEDRRLAREQADQTRRDLAQQSQIFQKSLADQSNATRLDIAKMSQAGQNKPPAGYRFLPDGSLEAIKGGPADQKLNTALSGKETVSSIVGGLRDSYNQLKAGGGITDPHNGALSNMAAGASSSALGQMAGRAFGTQNQSIRNSVQMTRPLLLQAIMKATGMSAKQMDSNTELKLYLATATDPTLDIDANMRALDKIEELYGQGAAGQPTRSQGALPTQDAISAEIARRGLNK